MMPAREGTGSHPVRTVGAMDEREPDGPTSGRRTQVDRRIAAVVAVAIGLLVLAFVLAAIAAGSNGGTG